MMISMMIPKKGNQIIRRDGEWNRKKNETTTDDDDDADEETGTADSGQTAFMAFFVSEILSNSNSRINIPHHQHRASDDFLIATVLSPSISNSNSNTATVTGTATVSYSAYS